MKAGAKPAVLRLVTPYLPIWPNFRTCHQNSVNSVLCHGSCGALAFFKPITPAFDPARAARGLPVVARTRSTSVGRVPVQNSKNRKPCLVAN